MNKENRDIPGNYSCLVARTGIVLTGAGPNTILVQQHHNIHNRMFPPCLTRGNTHRLLSFWYLPRTNCAYRVSEKINRILVQMAINPPKSFRNGKNLECFRKFSINAALMSTKIVKIDGENNREPA